MRSLLEYLFDEVHPEEHGPRFMLRTIIAEAKTKPAADAILNDEELGKAVGLLITWNDQEQADLVTVSNILYGLGDFGLTESVKYVSRYVEALLRFDDKDNLALHKLALVTAFEDAGLRKDAKRIAFSVQEDFSSGFYNYSFKEAGSVPLLIELGYRAADVMENTSALTEAHRLASQILSYVDAEAFDMSEAETQDFLNIRAMRGIVKRNAKQAQSKPA